MTTDNNETQAQALIDALAPKLAESILPQLQKQVEDQIAGVVKKNDELLGKLVASKQDAPDMSKLLAAAEEQIMARLQGQSFDSTPKPLTISKEDARNPRKYQTAKAQAEKAGVPLHIEGRQ